MGQQAHVQLPLVLPAGPDLYRRADRRQSVWRQGRGPGHGIRPVARAHGGPLACGRFVRGGQAGYRSVPGRSAGAAGTPPGWP